MLEHDCLTERIIGAAIQVHRTLGPGFVESIYEAALATELGHRGIAFERQVEVQILYRDKRVGLHRLDLVVSGEIVVELKAVKSLDPVHFIVVRSYLRALRRKHGLLLNFASAPLEV